MALEAVVPNYNDFSNLLVYETLHVPQYGCNVGIMEDVFEPEKLQNVGGGTSGLGSAAVCPPRRADIRKVNLGVQGRKKRRRRPKVCKNKEEAETQRMTHITVERNRRKQMNEHLAVLRSLMPESYAQRGDQASIVGGAIEFVKELEHLVRSLEVQKLTFLQQSEMMNSELGDTQTITHNNTSLTQEFFSDSDQTFSQVGNKYTLRTKAAVADIEVTLIETHANLRILWKKNPRQLSKLVSGFQTLRLTVLHLSVTAFDLTLALYSISVKVEEGCQLTSVDSIAEAVLHMLSIIEQDVPYMLTY